MDRKRLPHLTTFEKEALLELTVKYRSLVENKKTDASSAKEKLRGWKLIEGEFNAQRDTTNRSWQHLKKSWENIKHSARKANSATKRHCLATGGGGPTKEVVDPFLDKVDTLMPHINLRLNSPFDSDGFESQRNGEISEEETAIQVVVEDGDLVADLGIDGEDRVEATVGDSEPPSCVQHELSFGSSSKRKRMETPREAVKKYIEAKCEEEVVQARRLHELRISHEMEFHRRRMQYIEELHELDLEERRLKIRLIEKQLEK